MCGRETALEKDLDRTRLKEGQGWEYETERKRQDWERERK